MDRIQLQSFSQPALTRPIQALTQANQITSQYGLVLTEQQMLSLLQQRQEALEATGRVEFGDGVLHLLAERFCDSPFLCPANYEETLGELQALFYYFKNECRDRLTDREVLDGMKRLFDGVAQGATEYLAGVPIWTGRGIGEMDKALTRPFTASQAAAVETRLWGLLQRQVQHYTMAESSSVPIEVAQELLKGVNDLIGQGLYGEKDPQEQLLRGDLDQVIQRGLERVNQQVQEGLKLYQYVCAHPPVVTNRAYRETAANILAFFHTYQPQFMPHMIGCTIDYQLFLPVREGLEGIRFLNGYLTHLAAENRLLNCFDRGAVECVLNAASPDYEDLLLNLYQPVFQNALGRCLLGRDVLELSITAEERKELHRRLSPLSADELRRVVEQGAWALAQTFRMPALAGYLHQSAEEVLPRLQVALEHDSLAGIFVTC